MALPALLSPGASPPTGGAPIVPPSQSPGSEAAALAKVAQAVKILQDAFQGVDPAGDAGHAILKSIEQLTKVAPVTKAAPGVGQEALRNLAQQARQQAPLEMLLRQSQAAGGGGAPAGGAAPPAQ